ncbi:P-loop containing nucleoside triphosphate hydrolase protein [Hymenopellis radicata]|nr:P-loop containing nucleoside triphosphate hydrolase protein [Hymenopellis radicata]
MSTHAPRAIRPRGTAQRMKKSNPPKATFIPKPTRPILSDEDLEDIGQKCQEAWGWSYLPREGQIEAIKAQLRGRDTLVHAYTGYGKTCIAAGPFVHPSTKGQVTIMVSPLIALQDEQVETFEKEYKLQAVAVNSSHGGCKPETLKKIINGDYQIILISPELLQSRRFVATVMRNTEFTRRILSVIVDEAHVVSHWGAQFRKMYGSLGMVRAFLPRSASVVAMSATLPARVRNDVLTKLQFHKSDYVNIDVGNNRTNVSIIVRAIEHPMNTYKDLDFVIPSDVKEASEIPLTWIYADNIATGIEIEDHLMEILPESLRMSGIVRPYNASYSKEYRKEAMRLVREGKIRVLICTDAAGMGCNIPNIDLVVQWKLPSSLSSFWQRAGRAARGPGTTGRAVLLVEKSVYNVDLTAPKQDETPTNDRKSKKGKKGGKKNKKKKKDTTKRTKAEVQAHALCRGVKRGSHSGRTDAIHVQDQPPLDPEAVDEGLYVLAQTGLCRRLVIKEVFGNKDADAHVPCCDICCPDLLKQTRPGKYSTPKRRANIKKGKADFAGALFAGNGILPDDLLVLLSSVGPSETREAMDRILADQWKWSAQYGDQLFKCLQEMGMSGFVPLPKKSQGPKRKADDGAAPYVSSNDRPPTRVRVASAAPPSSVLNSTRTQSTAASSAAPSQAMSTPNVEVENQDVGSHEGPSITREAPSFQVPTVIIEHALFGAVNTRTVRRCDADATDAPSWVHVLWISISSGKLCQYYGYPAYPYTPNHPSSMPPTPYTPQNLSLPPTYQYLLSPMPPRPPPPHPPGPSS